MVDQNNAAPLELEGEHLGLYLSNRCLECKSPVNDELDPVPCPSCGSTLHLTSAVELVFPDDACIRICRSECSHHNRHDPSSKTSRWKKMKRVAYLLIPKQVSF